MTEKRMRNSRDLYVKRLRAVGDVILSESYRLDGASFDDADDLKRLQTIARNTENTAAEMGDLMEDIWVLAQDLEQYIQEQEEEENFDRF